MCGSAWIRVSPASALLTLPTLRRTDIGWPSAALDHLSQSETSRNIYITSIMSAGFRVADIGPPMRGYHAKRPGGVERQIRVMVLLRNNNKATYRRGDDMGLEVYTQ